MEILITVAWEFFTHKFAWKDIIHYRILSINIIRLDRIYEKIQLNMPVRFFVIFIIIETNYN